MINVRVEINSTEVDGAFSRLLQLANDPREGLDAVGRVLKAKVMLGFTSGTDPYGHPWPALTTRTGQPLRDKNHLMNSFDYRIDGNSVEIGTNLEYAKTHQFGAVIKPKPGKFWQSQHESVGKRGSKSYTVTQPAKLSFMVGDRRVFAKEVTIKPRPMLPLNGLPQEWSEDVAAAIGDVIARKWNK